MHILINNHPTQIYTASRPFNAEQPAVVLLHGAGHDHSVWRYQARYLAYHGFSVLVPDLPGHGCSQGAPLNTIEALAQWLIALIDHFDLAQVSLVGHSMGSLICAAATVRIPDRVDRLVMIGSAIPMPVTPFLLDAAINNRDRAHRMINHWSYAFSNQIGSSTIPGISLTGLNLRIMQRQAPGVLATDLNACNSWINGRDEIKHITCSTLLICGEQDQMTPALRSESLRKQMNRIPGGAQILSLPGTGHSMMAEAPTAITHALYNFLPKTISRRNVSASSLPPES